jgi:uncharacterized protein
MYYFGQGIGQSFYEAAKWYRAAAEQGDATAQTQLGVLRLEGKGLEKNYVEAAEWFRKAADQDDAWAQSFLGAEYIRGLGVPQDFVLAYMWFNLAAGQGLQNARDDRDKLIRYMTPAQISEAQRLSREWKPTR